MNSLSFPDVNVWLALALEHHVHRPAAAAWWKSPESARIGMNRATQMGFLRLLTTAAAMEGMPLSMSEAWEVHDRLFDDDRVGFFAEPPGLEQSFRQGSTSPTASPKVWADAYLLAFAAGHKGRLVTFDQALAKTGAHCLAPR